MMTIYLTDKSPLHTTVKDGIFTRVPLDKNDNVTGRVSKIIVENIEA